MKFAAPCGRRIRIVFCIDNLQIGGTELNAVRTAERLDRSAFELSVVALQKHGPLRERYEAAGIEVLSLPITSLYAMDTIRQGHRFARFLKNQRVDILHAHDIYSNIFGVTFARTTRQTRAIASRRWWADRRRPGLRLANRLSYSLAHVVLANSPSLAQLVIDEGVAQERVRVVPNFLDRSAFLPIDDQERDELLRELHVPSGVLVVGSIANLRPVKDHATLLEAFSRTVSDLTSPVHLVLVGDGECRSSLEASARRLRIEEYVHFAGRRANNPNLHQLFDVSVLNSLSEGSSNSILEAMAAAKPVVATDTGGNPDAVRHGETGLLIPVSDAAKLADALSHLLENPDLRHRMGTAGREVAESRYSADVALVELGSIYHELSGSRL